MKNILIFFVSLILLFSISLSAYASASGKISSWAEIYVSDARNSYHILPDSLESGDYTKNITREEFCELAYKTLEAKTGITISSHSSSFTDTDNAYIITLHDVGIIKGKSNTVFAPDDLLTREEAATILSRMADDMKLTLFKSTMLYTDANKISNWAQEGVEHVSGICVMNGMGNGLFSPKSYYTKEQAIATMIRLINNVPYLNNGTLIEGDKYFVFNQYYLWIKDDSGVIFSLPYSKYEGLDWYKKDGNLIIVAITREFKSEFYELSSGEKLFTIPYPVMKITDSRRYIISYQVIYPSANVDAAYELYGVYDFSGNEILPTEYDKSHLIENGYMDN